MSKEYEISRISAREKKGIWIHLSLFDNLDAKLSCKLTNFVLNISDDLNINDVKILIETGIAYYHIFSQDEVVDILKKKTPQELHFLRSYFVTCQWCKCSTIQLHGHHYPVARSKGGKKTVSICPNCHAEFHRLSDTNVFKIKKEYIELIENLQNQPIPEPGYRLLEANI